MDAKQYKYLLAVDGSAHANRAASYLARYGSRLRPSEIHVVSVLGPRIADLLKPEQTKVLLESGAESAAARRILDTAGIAYRFHSEMGDPAQKIVELARAEACDEIVVGSRGMSALDNLALGSVAYRVVHLSPVPVTVVPNPIDTSDPTVAEPERMHRILLAVDGSEASTKAVEYVCALRDARMPFNVRLLNVQLPIASGNVRRLVSQAIIDAYLRDEGLLALDTAKKALQAAGISFKDEILIGHAGEAIVMESLQRGCTRIVMGTRGRGAVASLLVGSTALQVLHRSELPVTLVK